MTDYLNNKCRDAIVSAIAANHEVDKAVLFGSRSMGTNTVMSDVDILLFGDSLTLSDLVRIGSIVDALPIPQKVGFVLSKNISNPALDQHIKTHGVEWYDRAKGIEGNLFKSATLLE